MPLLVCVRPHVLQQIEVVPEGFLTDDASKWLLARVDSVVQLHL